MKKWLSVFLTVLLCMNLAACGSSGQVSGSEDKTEQSLEQSQESLENKPQEGTGTAGESLPMNIGEIYHCVLDGVEGYVRVTEYEIIPDEMNEGCSGRNAFVEAVFYDAPEYFDLSAVVFAMNGLEEAIDEGMWLVSVGDGNQDVVIEYDNVALYSTYENGVYAERMMISYMVPDSYDELALAIVSGSQNASLESVAKEEVLTNESCWFIMGSLNQGNLTYNGEALATQTGNANENDMYAYLTTHAEQGSTSGGEIVPVAPLLDKTLKLIDFNAVMQDSHEGRELKFESIQLIEYSQETCRFEVVVSYRGFTPGDTLVSMLFDAYHEVHVDIAERTTDTEGTFTFEFTGNTESAPFTFTAGGWRDGKGLFISGIHVDGEIE